MRRALIVVNTSTYFTTLFPVARLVRETRAYEPVMWFATDYHNIERDLARCQAAAIQLVKEPGVSATSPGSEPAGRASFVRRVVRAVLDRSGLGIPKDSLRYVRTINRLSDRMKELIRTHDVALVILGGDLVSFYAGAYIKAARESQVGTVVVPGWFATPTEPAEAVYYERTLRVGYAMNWLVWLFAPQWVHRHRGRRLLRLDPSQIIALHWTNVAPPNPWVLHSGHSDAIAAENRAMKAYAIRVGLPEAQLVVTGSVAHDIMADITRRCEEHRADLYDELGFDAHRPLLLTALPPDAHYTGRPSEFPTYRGLAEYWISTLVDAGRWNVLVSVHPAAPRADFDFIAGLGARIATKDTLEVVPLCEAFVACVSSTIQWAIACSKPVVNYDVYRYRYVDYVGLPGVITVEGRRDFADVVQQLATDESYRARLTSAQEEIAADWGVLDGRAGERLLRLFRDVEHARTPRSVAAA